MIIGQVVYISRNNAEEFRKLLSMEGGDRSPVSFREPQVVNGGTNFCGGEGERRSNKPTDMTFSAKKPPRKKQAGGGRQCHNNIYGLLEDHVIKGSGRGRKEWCPKVRGEWGQRSSSLSPHLVRQHRTVRSAPSSAPTSAPTSPLTGKCKSRWYLNR